MIGACREHSQRLGCCSLPHGPRVGWQASSFGVGNSSYIAPLLVGSRITNMLLADQIATDIRLTAQQQLLANAALDESPCSARTCPLQASMYVICMHCDRPASAREHLLQQIAASAGSCVLHQSCILLSLFTYTSPAGLCNPVFRCNLLHACASVPATPGQYMLTCRHSITFEYLV